jgi:ubiquinone/menaquinone biosynthesis C-methylase UbiE
LLKPIAMMYDRIMRGAEEGCLTQWRTEILGTLSGTVLEIGAGTGRSLSSYPDSVTSLTLAEPDPNMRSQLVRVLAASGRSAEIVEAPAEHLPFPDATFDAVVSSLVLCSVHDQSSVLKEVHRVLRPHGQLAFIEHVAAQDRPQRLKWQRRVEPIWRPLMGNCHLTRNTEDAIVSNGFELVSVERTSMRGAMPVIRPTIRGRAAAMAS